MHASKCTCTYYYTAAPSSVAHFNDSRCVANGVCSTDPLLFTCELNEVIYLQVVLPNGYYDYISIGDNAADISLPAGFTVEVINIRVMNEVTGNISLALFIANASLLEGSEIKCYDELGNGVMAGCPLHVKPR